MRLIDVEKLLSSLEEWEVNETPNATTYPKQKEFSAYDMQRMIWRTIIDCESAVEEQPTVEAIPIELYEQVKGERDVAIEQLKSLNIELFEKPYLKAIPIEWIENWKRGKSSIEQVVADKIMMDYKYRDYWEKENADNS